MLLSHRRAAGAASHVQPLCDARSRGQAPHVAGAGALPPAQPAAAPPADGATFTFAQVVRVAAQRDTHSSDSCTAAPHRCSGAAAASAPASAAA